MPNSLPPLLCPNLKCRKSNTEYDQFCQQCGTPLPKHYLWVIGPTQEGYQPEDSLGERFVLKGPHVALDSQPGYPVRINADVPELLLPYLKLFPYRLHIPQLYTVIFSGPNQDQPIALLEQAPLSASDLFPVDIAVENPGPPLQIGSAQPLMAAWSQTHVLRQVNWLWQLSQLWQPMASQGVVSTLLDPNLLRVEERLLRVLELKPDAETLPTLADLGAFWEQWVPQTQAPFKDAFAQVCRELTMGSITAPEVLQVQLERLLDRYRESYKVRIDIAARTDTGPMRDHNEDACYPNSGGVFQNSNERLAIVCDGVGGHAGGEVASGIAIEALTTHLTALQQEKLSAEAVTHALEEATFKANDLISEKNDAEQRQDRQRMGTTLVTALVHGEQLYIAHVGDSRAYLITNTGCYQVTVDDDIASREVRLGYVPYREALQQPAAGSLIQALGMASSVVLRPTVQRFILDEDCVLLLCSDGLSDYDRVETLWQSEIRPLLYNDTDLVTVAKSLIEQANRLNGHDNVTVALLNCRITRQRVEGRAVPPTASSAADAVPQALPSTQIPDQAADDPQTGATTQIPEPTPAAATTADPPVQRQIPWRPLLFVLGLISLAAGSLAVILSRSPVPKPIPDATATPEVTDSPTPTPPAGAAPTASPESPTPPAGAASGADAPDPTPTSPDDAAPSVDAAPGSTDAEGGQSPSPQATTTAPAPELSPTEPSPVESPPE